MKTESPENVNTDPSENSEHNLVNTMKNIFSRQEHEVKEGLSEDNKGAVTMNKDLEARLLDSAEIVLYTTSKPFIYKNPELKLDSPKLNTMV